MINTWAVPQPLNTSRLKTALAHALQSSHLNAARLVVSKNDGTWRFELVNQVIALTIGFSSRPGPFHPKWKGERDPDCLTDQTWSNVLGLSLTHMSDYYDELPRGGASLDQDTHDILTKIKVTTWTSTGQTSTMASQSHCLGKSFGPSGQCQLVKTDCRSTPFTLLKKVDRRQICLCKIHNRMVRFLSGQTYYQTNL